ncbi:DNA polymerase I [Thermoactinomyces daqus]|uniref:DNA-directed DNA polymerase n=1 Tax=Thermoactinomyces daqus TaxID=1329516 RepID=A0A7W1XAB7_9BACL|nr:DNA polymerase [Thermoactinomyces daqus]MBA4542936.1 DNA polymerase I [Thermoactinomyces daqus]
MEIKLTLNQNSQFNAKSAKERIKQVNDLHKPLAEQIEQLDIPTNERELHWFKLGKEAILSGKIQRQKDGAISKAELVRYGKEIAEQQELDLKRERARKVIETKPDNFFILRHDHEIPQFMKRLRQECKLQREHWKNRWIDLGVKSMVAGDVETTGIDSYIDLTIGISIWLPYLNEGYYLPYGHVHGIDRIGKMEIPYEFQHKKDDPQLTRSKVLEAIKPFMEAETEGKTFHMGATLLDMHMAVNDGYQINGLIWDTLNAMKVMNEHEPSYGLKPLVRKYGKHFGIDGEIFTFDDLFGNCSPAPFDIELVGIYAIKDTLYGWKLFEWQMEVMKKTDKLYNVYTLIDKNLPTTDFMLQRTGFNLDSERLNELNEKFTSKLAELERELFETYNINDEFLWNMTLKLKKKDIDAWIESQKKRIKTWEERVQKKKQKLKEWEQQGKTHLKSYKTTKQELDRLLKQKPVAATIENLPDKFRITEFSLTNHNHISYLIYDYLKIEDITPQFERGKTRSTSTKILKEYFETEPALKPLKEVSALQKLLTTYVRKLPEAVEIDGKIHSRFDSTGAQTGRYASSGYDGRPIEVYEEIKERWGKN